MRQLLLQVVFAWHALEYMMRIALRRLKGASINQAEVQTIMTMRNPFKVIKQLREAAEDPKANSAAGTRIGDILDSVGKGRGTKSLMARVNTSLHAALAGSPAGREFYVRLGGSSEPVSIDTAWLSQLVADLNAAIDELDRLTA
jgi:hypothetical protein